MVQRLTNAHTTALVIPYEIHNGLPYQLLAIVGETAAGFQVENLHINRHGPGAVKSDDLHGLAGREDLDGGLPVGLNAAGQNGINLLGNIPGAMYNSINRSLSFYGSRNIIVLVDSIEHDFNYIARLNQKRFDKINITYNPSGKYRGYDAVINLKTRPHYQGYDGNVEFYGTAYTGNRNGNGNALGSESVSGQFTYTYDKINVGGSIGNSWANRAQHLIMRIITQLNGIKQTVLHTPFNHPATISIDRNTSANAFVDYHIDDNNVIAASYFFRFGDSNSDTRYRLQVDDFNRNTSSINELHSNNHTHNSLSHNAVAYYWGNVRNWRLHAFASYNSNSLDSYSTTERNSFAVTDNRHIHTDKIWAGGQISRSFANNEWTASARYYYNRNSHNQYALADKRKLAHSVDINQFPELDVYFNPDGSAWSMSLKSKLTTTFVSDIITYFSFWSLKKSRRLASALARPT